MLALLNSSGESSWTNESKMMNSMREKSDWAALAGILFVLPTGSPWAYLPSEMCWGSGATCWCRLHEWQTAGVWQRLERTLLNRLWDADRLDWRRTGLDDGVGNMRGETTGPSPTDRGRGRRPPGMQRLVRWYTTLRI
jgi:transposase